MELSEHPAYYTLPPEHRDELINYLLYGVVPKHPFAFSLLTNDFTIILGCASDTEVERIWEYATFLHKHVPVEAKGSADRVYIYSMRCLVKDLKYGEE